MTELADKTVSTFTYSRAALAGPDRAWRPGAVPWNDPGSSQLEKPHDGSLPIEPRDLESSLPALHHSRPVGANTKECLHAVRVARPCSQAQRTPPMFP